METFHRLYVRLILVQGACLALAIGLSVQWRNLSQSTTPGGEQRAALSDSRFPFAVSPAWKGNSVIFLGAWGMLAGVTGWLMMKEQRDQMLALLQKHDDLTSPELRLLSSDEPLREESFSDGNSLQESFDMVPASFRLRLALDDESAWAGEAERDCCETPHPPLRIRPECQLHRD